MGPGLLAQILEKFLYPREKSFAFRVGLFLLAGLFELAQQFLLALGQIDRRLDDRLDIHVAADRRAQHRHALAAQPELVPILRPGRDGNARPAAIDGRYLDRSAERGRRKRNRHPAVDVGAIALEDRMRRETDENIKITRRRAVRSDLALAGQPNARAVLDARRNVDREGLFLAHAPLPATGLARFLDRLSGAVASRTRLFESKKPLLAAYPTVPVTGAAADRPCTRLGTAALARIAMRECGNTDRRVLALE